MADLIQIKSGDLGDRGEMPELEEDELGYVKDTGELYIGTKTGNKKIGDIGWEARIKALEEQLQTITAHSEG